MKKKKKKVTAATRTCLVLTQCKQTHTEEGNKLPTRSYIQQQEINHTSCAAVTTTTTTVVVVVVNVIIACDTLLF